MKGAGEDHKREGREYNMKENVVRQGPEKPNERTRFVIAGTQDLTELGADHPWDVVKKERIGPAVKEACLKSRFGLGGRFGGEKGTDRWPQRRLGVLSETRGGGVM